jgi:hypothetical protein
MISIGTYSQEGSGVCSLSGQIGEWCGLIIGSMNHKTDVIIPRSAKLLFIGLILFMLVIQVVLAVYSGIIYYSSGPSFKSSEWLLLSLGLSLVPFILFSIAYFLTLKTQGRLIRLFFAALYQLLFTIINTLLGAVLLSVARLTFPDRSFSTAIELIAPAITIILLVITLVVLRPKPHKQSDDILYAHTTLKQLIIATYCAVTIAAIASTVQLFLNNNLSPLGSSIPLFAVVAGMMFVGITYILLSPTAPHRMTKALFYTMLPALVAVVLEQLFPIAYLLLSNAGLGGSITYLSASPYPVIGIIAIYLVVIALMSRKKLL